MGINQRASRPWMVFSSSSGETLRAFWNGLDPQTQMAYQGTFCDRDCGSAKAAKELSAKQVYVFDRKTFESQVLKQLHEVKFAQQNGLVLLLGFFGILSPEFLGGLGVPVINTHPSLLPSFPGLDKKVHHKAWEDVAISGFTVHLVNEHLDGGAILFQHPVFSQADETEEVFRMRIRQQEQYWLPKIWQQLVVSNLKTDDRHQSSRTVRMANNINLESFVNKGSI